MPFRDNKLEDVALTRLGIRTSLVVWGLVAFRVRKIAPKKEFSLFGSVLLLCVKNLAAGD